jgi:hypothetical protein
MQRALREITKVLPRGAFAGRGCAVSRGAFRDGSKALQRSALQITDSLLQGET